MPSNDDSPEALKRDLLALLDRAIAFGRHQGDAEAVARILKAVSSETVGEPAPAPEPAQLAAPQKSRKLAYGAKKQAVRTALNDLKDRGGDKYEIQEYCTNTLGVPLSVPQVTEALRDLSQRNEAEYRMSKWFPARDSKGREPGATTPGLGESKPY